MNRPHRQMVVAQEARTMEERQNTLELEHDSKVERMDPFPKYVTFDLP